MFKFNRLIKEPIKELLKTETNKVLTEKLNKRNINRKDKNYKKNRTKEIDQQLKELNQNLKPNEYFYFDGKKINKFNLNILELRNINKLLTPQDRKQLTSVTAIIALRIEKQIRKRNFKLKDNSGKDTNMSLNYLLSLPLEKIKTIVTDYEYNKLFSIVKRIPEKNINYILKNYSEVRDINTKNRYVVASNILIKVGVAKLKGLIRESKENYLAKKGKLLKTNISFNEFISKRYKLFDKYYTQTKKNNPAILAQQEGIYSFYGIDYFKRIDYLLNKYIKTHGEKISPEKLAQIENIVGSSIMKRESKSNATRAYKRLLKEESESPL